MNFISILLLSSQLAAAPLSAGDHASTVQHEEPADSDLKYESVTLKDGGPAATIHILCRAVRMEPRPAILMLGSLYENFGHNLPLDVVKMHAKHWFRLYMHPTRPPPQPVGKPGTLPESVRRTQINSSNHKDVVGARE